MDIRSLLSSGDQEGAMGVVSQLIDTIYDGVAQGVPESDIYSTIVNNPVLQNVSQDALHNLISGIIADNVRDEDVASLVSAIARSDCVQDLPVFNLVNLLKKIFIYITIVLCMLFCIKAFKALKQDETGTEAVLEHGTYYHQIQEVLDGD